MINIQIDLPPELEAALQRMLETGEPVVLQDKNGKDRFAVVDMPTLETLEATRKERLKKANEWITSNYSHTFQRLANE